MFLSLFFFFFALPFLSSSGLYLSTYFSVKALCPNFGHYKGGKKSGGILEFASALLVVTVEHVHSYPIGGQETKIYFELFYCRGSS